MSEETWLIFELKSLNGRVSRVQKAVRLAMLAGRGKRFLCRAAKSALVALHRIGVRFRRAVTRRSSKTWNCLSLTPTQRMAWHPEVP